VFPVSLNHSWKNYSKKGMEKKEETKDYADFFVFFVDHFHIRKISFYQHLT